MSVADKRAALEMHHLGREDREWVLHRLPPAEQARVRPLLAELDGMQIRFDIESEVSLNSDDHSVGAGSTTSVTTGMSERLVIRDASATDVLRVLSDEPEWVISAVLALDEWPWSATVRNALSENGGLRRLSSAHRNDPLPHGLSATLLPILAERLRTSTSPRVNGRVNGHRSAVNGMSTWSRVWPKVKQWLP